MSMENLKILWTLDSPFYPIHGGSARVMYHQATLAAERGAEAFALCRNKENSNSTNEMIEGVKSYSFPVKAKGFYSNFIKSCFNGRWAFNEIIKAEKLFDFMVFHQPLTAMAVESGSPKRNYRKIYSYHSPFSLEFIIRNRSSFFKDWFHQKCLNAIERNAMKGSDLILFDSEYMQKEALKIHPQLESFPRMVLPLGVDLNRFTCKKNTQEPRNRLSLAPTGPIAFTVRNLERRMGLGRLIRAWADVVDKIPEATLIIGGEGSLESNLLSLIDEYKLKDNVFLVGYIPEKKLPLYYQSADLFVLPTTTLEGFGLVTLEALASGTPVLGTRVGAIPEILSPLDPSLIFQSRRHAVMAERIIAFFKENECEKFTPDVCRQYVEGKYSWDVHMEKFEGILNQMKQRQTL